MSTTRTRFSTLDLNIAKAMWECDAQRPCSWRELDSDEQSEWAQMASAAREYLTEHFAQAASQQPLPRSADIGAALQPALQGLIKSTVRELFGKNASDTKPAEGQ